MSTANWINLGTVVISVLALFAAGIAVLVTMRIAEANEATAASSADSASSSKESAKAAQDAVDVQRAIWTEQKRADLVLSEEFFIWKIDPADSDKGTCTIGLRNEGYGSAFETVVAGYFHQTGHHTYSSSTIGTFDDREREHHRDHTPQGFHHFDTQLFNVTFRKQDFGTGDKRHVTFRVHYRDGLGKHQLDVKKLLFGLWGPDNYMEVNISRRVDGTLTMLQENPDHDNLRVDGEVELPCPSR